MTATAFLILAVAVVLLTVAVWRLGDAGEEIGRLERERDELLRQLRQVTGRD